MFDRVAERLAPTPGLLKSVLAAWSASVLLALGTFAIWGKGRGALADAGLSATPAAVLMAASLVLSLAWCWLKAVQHFRGLLSPATCRMDEVNPFRVGVWYSELAERTRRSPGDDPAPYVVRGALDKLLLRTLELLGNGRGPNGSTLLIVRGSAVSGKSRSTLEAVKSAFPRRTLLVPKAMRLGDENDPLLELLTSTAPLGYLRSGGVLWLDGIGARLRAGDISADLLEAFIRRHRRVVIVMTMTIAEHKALKCSTGEYAQAASSVLKAATTVSVSPSLLAYETADAAGQYPGLTGDLTFLPRLFAAADDVGDGYQLSSEESPTARAITDAAIDYMRAGGLGAVPEAFLRTTYLHYLSAVSLKPTFSEGLAYAAEEIRGGSGLLERADSGWRVPSYLVDEVSRSERGIPPIVWVEVLEAVNDNVPNLLSLGCAAADAGQATVAERAWARAGELGNERQRRYASMFQEAMMSDRVAPELRELMQAARVGIGDLLQQDTRVAARRGPESDTHDPEVVFSTGFVQKPRSLARCVYRHWLARRATRVLLLALGDLAALSVGVWLAMALRSMVGHGPADIHQRFGELLDLLPLLSVSTVLSFSAYDLYREDRPRLRAVALAPALLVVGVMLLVYEAWNGKTEPALSALVGAALAFPVCAGFRGGYDLISRRWLRWTGLEARALLIGTAAQCHELAGELARNCTRPMRFVGYLSPDSGDHGQGCHGTIDDLADAVAIVGVDRVIIADPEISDALVMTISERCAARRIPVEVVPSTIDLQLHRDAMSAGPGVLLRPIESPLLSVGDLIVKRFLDVTVGVTTLVMLSPVMLVITIAIKLESGGPATWKTYRPGKGGRVFGMRKYRTTVAVPDPYEERSGTEHDGEVVTRVGRILRRLALDEIPQLVNVLYGEMSLVGPRPVPIADFRRLDDWHKKRYLVPPGITGLWQLSGRQTRLVDGELLIDYDHLARLDLRYAHHWTLWHDLTILAKTPFVVLRQKTNLPTSAR